MLLWSLSLGKDLDKSFAWLLNCSLCRCLETPDATRVLQKYEVMMQQLDRCVNIFSACYAVHRRACICSWILNALTQCKSSSEFPFPVIREHGFKFDSCEAAPCETAHGHMAWGMIYVVITALQIISHCSHNPIWSITTYCCQMRNGLLHLIQCQFMEGKTSNVYRNAVWKASQRGRNLFRL